MLATLLLLIGLAFASHTVIDLAGLDSSVLALQVVETAADDLDIGALYDIGRTLLPALVILGAAVLFARRWGAVLTLVGLLGICAAYAYAAVAITTDVLTPFNSLDGVEGILLSVFPPLALIGLVLSIIALARR